MGGEGGWTRITSYPFSILFVIKQAFHLPTYSGFHLIGLQLIGLSENGLAVKP